MIWLDVRIIRRPPDGPEQITEGFFIEDSITEALMRAHADSGIGLREIVQGALIQSLTSWNRHK